MPTSPPLEIPAIHRYGRIGTRAVYGENHGTPYRYNWYRDLPQPTPPVFNPDCVANQIDALFKDLTPTELATWHRPATRKALPVRTFFLGYNLKRYNHARGNISRCRRTYP